MSSADLHAHLASGPTHVCQAWAVTRRDGVTLGFTDHDMPLQFDGMTFAANSGLSAKALTTATGLSVDNTEAMGLLTHDAINEADIAAGKYDGAEVRVWLVQWDKPAARALRFRGTIGEITRVNGAFHADLRGLAEALNQPQGRAYLRTCSVVLGDAACRVNLDGQDFMVQKPVASVTGGQVFGLNDISQYRDRWFEHGTLEVLSGDAAGLSGVIKLDNRKGNTRQVTLWQAIPAVVAVGDLVRLVAGCDKRFATCQTKFGNLVNFQGFPDIPGDDWLVGVPRSRDDADGGSLRP